jgi:DNA-binding SARP family transcriptional activator/ABC-type cobalamin/Fe3+-siderophores transport system ATPase subunit
MPETLPTAPEVNQHKNWRLQLCGRPQAISAQGQAIVLERRDAAMLALLAIDGPTARERVMVLLWPDEDTTLVRNRLRQRIFTLKRKLGAEAVVGQLTLSLAAPLQWLGFEQEAQDKPLLGGDAHADLPEFAQWLATVRERRQGAQRERLAAAASSLEAEGRLAEAIVAAEQLLALEPLQEHAHRRLMRLHYLRGDRAAALLAFDRCEQLLKDEVGATPSSETLELLAQIERSQALASAAGPAARRVVPASVLRPPRLIGRDAEWARLQAAWAHGEAVVVIGEAGMGKTRLVGDLVRAHAPEPGSALQLSARPGDERVPYALLSRMLRGLLVVRKAALAEGIEAELARLLPELPQRTKAGGASDAAAQARFVGAIETTLQEAVAAGLQAVVLDDLHFADAASLEMAQHLSATPGLRWLTAFRGAEIDPAAQALVDTLTGRLQAEPIVLQPLTSAHVHDLVESLGIVTLDAPALAGALHQRTGGNPLFLLETLKALLLQGEPARTGIADLRALARLPPSGGAARLIERRIGQLSRDAVRLARCAAVAGQDFSAVLAARALDVNPLDLADAWLELESAQVMRDGAFAHDLIFEAARASVPEPIARALHRRIAELMAAEGTAPARLAAHWLGAGEELRAAPHLAEAGRLALRAMRMREGLEYLDQAQSIFGRAGDADAQCSLIDELVSPAVMASSCDNVQRLVEQAARNASTDRQRSMTLRSLATLLEQRCEYDRATEIGGEALAAALAARDRPCELGARALLAELLGERCQADEAEEMLRPIECWVNEHGSAEHRLVYAEALAKVLTHGANLARALDQWQRAIDFARADGADHALPNLLMTRAITLVFTGRAQEGRDALVEARQLLHDIPEDAMILRSFNVRLQVIDRTLGHYTSSLMLGERVLADPATGPAEIDEVRLPQAFAFCDLGQPARARQLLLLAGAPAGSYTELFWKEVGAQVPQPGAQLDEARRLALAAAAQAAGKWSGRSLFVAWRIQARHAGDDDAVLAARRGVEFAVNSGMHGHQLVFQALLAQRLATLGDTAQAVWLAKDSWRLMAEFCPGLVYRGVVWQALIEVLEPHDAALGRTIARTAADWIFSTAAEHIPPAFRESFLHRNPANAFLLAKARCL